MAPLPDSPQVLQWLSQCCAGVQASCDLVANAILVRIRLYISLRLRRRPKRDQDDVIQNIMEEFWKRKCLINEEPYRYALVIGRLKVLEYFAEIKKAYLQDPIDVDADGYELQIPDPTADLEKWLLHKERIRKILDVIRYMEPFCQRLVKGLLGGFTVAEIFADESSRDPKLIRTNFDVKKKRCIVGLQQYLPNIL